MIMSITNTRSLWSRHSLATSYCKVVFLAGLLVAFESLTCQAIFADKHDGFVENVRKSFSVAGYQFEITHPQVLTLEALNLDLNQPRILFFHGQRLFVGSKSGEVYWLDPPYQKANVLVTLDRYPHSVVVRDNMIYIARTNGIYRAPYSAETRQLDDRDIALFVSLPGGGGHNSRTLKLGPDRRLYVSLGIRGNCSDEYLDYRYPVSLRRGGILVIDESGDHPTLVPYGTGLRNPVGFDWHPKTQMMYASNNGPDHLGYHQPPEYFSKITPGSFHGMPWFQFDGHTIHRDSCVDSAPPGQQTDIPLPVVTFPARIAPMDIHFVDNRTLLEPYYGNAIVALHGSWATDTSNSNGGPASRRHPKLVMVRFDHGVAKDVGDLLTGFQLPDGRRWARPVGVAIGPDGHIYFTSDAGIEGLYRLRVKPQ